MFKPIIDNKLIVGKNITIYSINDSHHKNRLRNYGFTMYLCLSYIYYSFCVVQEALLIAEELNHPIHNFTPFGAKL